MQAVTTSNYIYWTKSNLSNWKISITHHWCGAIVIHMSRPFTGLRGESSAPLSETKAYNFFGSELYRPTSLLYVVRFQITLQYKLQSQLASQELPIPLSL